MAALEPAAGQAVGRDAAKDEEIKQLKSTLETLRNGMANVKQEFKSSMETANQENQALSTRVQQQQSTLETLRNGMINVKQEFKSTMETANQENQALSTRVQQQQGTITSLEKQVNDMKQQSTPEGLQLVVEQQKSEIARLRAQLQNTQVTGGDVVMPQVVQPESGKPWNCTPIQTSAAYLFPVAVFPSESAQRLGLTACGPVLLRVSWDKLCIVRATPQRETVIAWRFERVVRYGMDLNLFSFETAPLDPRGAGVFYMVTSLMREIFQTMRAMAAAR